MQGHGLICRKSPRCGGPNNHRDGAAASVIFETAFCDKCVGVDYFETYIDGVRSFVFIFNFCFRQGRTTVNAPVNRLIAFNQVTIFNDLAERTDNIGLSLVGHGEVGCVPFAHHTQPFEVLALAIRLQGSVVSAFFTEGRGTNLNARLTDFFLNL